MRVNLMRASVLAGAMALVAGSISAAPGSQSTSSTTPSTPAASTAPGSGMMPPPPPPPPQGMQGGMQGMQPGSGNMVPPPPMQPADENVDESGMNTPPIDTTTPGGDDSFPGGLNGPDSGATDAITPDMTSDGKPFNPMPPDFGNNGSGTGYGSTPGNNMPPPPPPGANGANGGMMGPAGQPAPAAPGSMQKNSPGAKNKQTQTKTQAGKTAAGKKQS